jgi:hypothetical protein
MHIKESPGMFLWGSGSYGRGAYPRSGNFGALEQRAVSKVVVAPLGQIFTITGTFPKNISKSL